MKDLERGGSLTAAHEMIDKLQGRILANTELDTEQKRDKVKIACKYLKESATRASKIDWLNIVVGTLVQLILTLALQNGNELFALCKKSFTHFLSDH